MMFWLGILLGSLLGVFAGVGAMLILLIKGKFQVKRPW
jgi:hypothetical protein